MRKFMSCLAIAILFSTIVGCDDDVKKLSVSDNSTNSIPTHNTRFSIESFGWFEAGYNNNKREIIIIKDSKTGKEYLGVTGVGVTEMVPSGKTQAEE